MTWKEMFMAPVAVGVIALFGGMGVLMWRIGGTWDQRNTDALTTSFAVICAGGVMLSGMLLAIFIGIPFALRILESRDQSRSMQIDRRIADNAFRQARDEEQWARRNERPIDGEWNVLPPDARPLLPAPGNGMPGALPFDGMSDNDDNLRMDW